MGNSSELNKWNFSLGLFLPPVSIYLYSNVCILLPCLKNTQTELREQSWQRRTCCKYYFLSKWKPVILDVIFPPPLYGGYISLSKKIREYTTSLSEILRCSEWYVCFLCLWNYHLAKNSSLIFWHEGHLKVLLPASLIHFVDKRLSQGSLRCPSLLDFLSV